ncbi:hypothetical protein [Erythrobacter sp. YT30]|uniref:hypothetical protein n=1 Tax=Erythrobacter sp. YT30 TaxID=1735012 RepID=UPI00076CA378|nr:hypothetical protein [Erythrobacter sp. YT30]KWV90853.1 hypothetical protein AUC45_05770 [Erythrobacter sp. YT30]
MMDPVTTIAAASLIGLALLSVCLLRAWQGWLDLKREQMNKTPHSSGREIEGNAGVGAARIELADLKERIKKLEAIASGVEL